MKKKIWLFLMSCFASALILSACSSEEGSSSGNEQENGTVQIDDEKVKASLEEFQNEVNALIDDYDDDFNQFAETVEEKTGDVSEEDLEALKNEAAQSSEKLAAELRNLEIPAELEGFSEDLNESLGGLADEFEARSENLNSEDAEAALEKVQTASEDILADFKGALASIYESLGLENSDEQE